MMRLLLMALTLAAFATPAISATRVRLALVIGANDGGPERVRLRYAGRDAEGFATVMNRLGGVKDEHLFLVLNPSLGQIDQAFTTLETALKTLPNNSTEVVIYYSGHSDEKGLLIGNSRLGYTELRARIEALPVDARITIVDACAAGAMLTAKGGVRQKPFLVDEASMVRGSAFLASASEDEAAQESDRIQASFFTHALVTGLRGAADVSGDHVVTLNEAYQFAFRETLMRTEGTRLGAQHPSYDMQLTGSGDLVLTDLRDTSATLRLDTALGGRFFVRDNTGRLVAELHKPQGQPIELGLPSGAYTTRLDAVDGRKYKGSFALGVRGAVTVSLNTMAPYEGELTVARGTAGTVVSAPPAKKVKFGASIVPGLNTDGGNAARTISLNFIGTSHSVQGVEISALSGTAREGIVGAQIAGLHAGSLGDVQGIQMTGVFAHSRNLEGGQVAGVASYAGDIEGLQISGVASWGGHLEGAQLAGVAVRAKNVVGIQLAGIGTWSDDLKGVQLSGITNHARSVEGGQISLINYGGTVHGAQIGLINVATEVNGLQLGLVNVAQRMKGASIGLVPWVTEGRHHLEVFGTQASGLNGGFRLGSSSWHSAFSFGGNPETEDLNAQIAVGGHIAFSRMWLDIDAFTMQVFEKGSFDQQPFAVHGARLLLGADLTNGLALFGGPTWNVAVNDKEYDPGFTPTYAEKNGAQFVQQWPGFIAGARFF